MVLDEGELTTDQKEKIHDAINKRLPMDLGLRDKISRVEIHQSVILQAYDRQQADKECEADMGSGGGKPEKLCRLSGIGRTDGAV